MFLEDTTTVGEAKEHLLRSSPLSGASDPRHFRAVVGTRQVPGSPLLDETRPIRLLVTSSPSLELTLIPLQRPRSATTTSSIRRDVSIGSRKLDDDDDPPPPPRPPKPKQRPNFLAMVSQNQAAIHAHAQQRGSKSLETSEPPHRPVSSPVASPPPVPPQQQRVSAPVGIRPPSVWETKRAVSLSTRSRPQPETPTPPPRPAKPQKQGSSPGIGRQSVPSKADEMFRSGGTKRESSASPRFRPQPPVPHGGTSPVPPRPEQGTSPVVRSQPVPPQQPSPAPAPAPAAGASPTEQVRARAASSPVTDFHWIAELPSRAKKDPSERPRGVPPPGAAAGSAASTKKRWKNFFGTLLNFISSHPQEETTTRTTPREEQRQRTMERWKSMSQMFQSEPPPHFDVTRAPTIDVRIHKVNTAGNFAVMSEVMDVFEAVHFRSQISKSIQRNINLTEMKDQKLFCEITKTLVPLPSHFPKAFPVSFHFSDATSKSFVVEVICTGADTLDDALGKATTSRIPADAFRGKALRIHGTRIFAIHPATFSAHLESLSHVRESVLRHRPVRFCVEDSPVSVPAGPPPATAASSSSETDWITVPCVPITIIPASFLFPVRILGVERILIKDIPKEILKSYSLDPRADFEQLGVRFSISVAVFYSSVRLGSKVPHTSTSPKFYFFEWLVTDVPICRLPRESHVVFTVNIHFRAKTDPLAWCPLTVFDENGFLRTGFFELSMWPWAPGARQHETVAQNPDRGALKLLIEFDGFSTPVFCDQGMHGNITPRAAPGREGALEGKIPADQEIRIREILRRDPLHELSEQEKELLWTYREWIRKSRPQSLPTLLLATNWHDYDTRAEVMRLVSQWPPLHPVYALVLLGSDFVDTAIRNYAVRCISNFTDDQLVDFLLPLVQALKVSRLHVARHPFSQPTFSFFSLKFERYHYSALAEFLLLRGLGNRLEVGHYLFWYLQSELHVPEHKVRFGLMISAYLWACGAQKLELATQLTLVKMLVDAQQRILESDSTRIEAFLRPLSAIPWPETSLPTNPKTTVKSIVTQRCRCMKSHQKPLWLEFQNSDLAEPVPVIFKAGDDLRQDSLTLHALNIMDKMWKQAGLDLGMSTYRCMPCGDAVGLIEVVPNAKTMAKIQKDETGLTGPLRSTSMRSWLEKRNPDATGFDMATTNFALSSAAYAVATYVLGIGDRHNDNIMIDTSGHIFHIDFAYFLGNVVKFGFYDREKAPFVLTPEFVQMMGGAESPKFALFAETCCTAFNILRHNAPTFFNLFKMMLSTGIAQLRDEGDLLHLRETLHLEKTDKEATAEFLHLIEVSLNCVTTRVLFFTHALAHLGDD